MKIKRYIYNICDENEKYIYVYISCKGNVQLQEHMTVIFVLKV